MRDKYDFNEILNYIQRDNLFSFGYEYQDLLGNKGFTEVNLYQDSENKDMLIWKRVSGWGEGSYYNKQDRNDLMNLRDKLMEEINEHHLTFIDEVLPDKTYFNAVNTEIINRFNSDFINDEEFKYLSGAISNICYEYSDAIDNIDSSFHKDILSIIIDGRINLLRDVLNRDNETSINQLIENNIPIISDIFASRIIASRLPEGTFIVYTSDSYVSIDNKKGDAFTEDFTSFKKAILYLNGYHLEELENMSDQENGTFFITVTETRSKVVELHAMTMNEAFNKVNNDYLTKDIVLTEDDISSYDIYDGINREFEEVIDEITGDELEM